MRSTSIAMAVYRTHVSMRVRPDWYIAIKETQIHRDYTQHSNLVAHRETFIYHNTHVHVSIPNVHMVINDHV